jgi:hypothetical protein
MSDTVIFSLSCLFFVPFAITLIWFTPRPTNLFKSRSETLSSIVQQSGNHSTRIKELEAQVSFLQSQIDTLADQLTHVNYKASE